MERILKSIILEVQSAETREHSEAYETWK